MGAQRDRFSARGNYPGSAGLLRACTKAKGGREVGGNAINDSSTTFESATKFASRSPQTINKTKNKLESSFQQSVLSFRKCSCTTGPRNTSGGLTFSPESYLIRGRQALSMLQEMQFRLVQGMLALSSGRSRFCVGFVFVLSLDNQRLHGLVETWDMCNGENWLVVQSKCALLVKTRSGDCNRHQNEIKSHRAGVHRTTFYERVGAWFGLRKCCHLDLDSLLTGQVCPGERGRKCHKTRVLHGQR